MNENVFQRKVIQRLKSEFPECIVMKQDATYKQVIPDLVIFHHDKYAMLECKKSATASHQPQQDYYISKIKEWAYASFIYPENVDQVFRELKEVFV